MQKTTLVASLVLAALAVAVPALAGPPFTCHPFDIGSARSLPWNGDDWLGVKKEYDINRVVADTEALLTPAPPTLVRMETLRRAALYASLDRAVAQELILALVSRVKVAEFSEHPDPALLATALFDAGYAIEALSEIEQFGNHMKPLAGREHVLAGLTAGRDPRGMIERSATLRPGDASIQFALALISQRPERTAHAEKARRGAELDELLASNLVRLPLQ
jgi:hypothetical protein